MMMRIVFGVAAAAICLAASATAQPVSPPPDAARLQLAHQLIEASGGAAAVRSRMTAMFDSVHKMTASLVPADASGVADDMFKFIADEELKAVPQLIDQSAEVYAEHLTEGELRAMLAWTSSPEGQSVQRKSPAITQDILLRQQPMMKQMMSGMLQRAADHACAEDHCTPEQAQQLVAMLSQFAGGAPQAAPATTAKN